MSPPRFQARLIGNRKPPPGWAQSDVKRRKRNCGHLHEQGVSMHADDVVAFLVDYLRSPRPDHGYSTYGYEIWLPLVVDAYLREKEQTPENPNPFRPNCPRAAELSPLFLEAAWHLCRRGILRPGIKAFGAQATPEGASGYGYCLTTHGRRWIDQGASAVFLADPDRLSQMFNKLSERLGP